MLNTLKERFKNRKRYLHTNIDHLMNREMIDVPELSSQTGIPVATIFRMKRYDNNPTIEPRDGDYILCELNKENTPVLRQLFIDGKKYFFKPINPNYDHLEQIKEFKILGVIIKSIENYR